MSNPLNLREIVPLDWSQSRYVLTVDVEEWYHVNYTSADLSRIDTSVSSVEKNVELILQALQETGSTATFFVLGCIAEKHPEIVRAIGRAGHEVACHSYHHTLIYEQTRAEFAQDLRRAAALLSNLAGNKISGFRAPSCSITERNPWALDVLCECGFLYDSSIFPIKNYMYGVDGFPLHPCRLKTTEGNRLVEFPLQVLEFGGLKVPFGGGIYVRLLPAFVHRQLVRFNHSRGRSFMLYFHPSDIDSIHHEIPLSPKEKFFNNVGRRSGRRKILRLLRDFRWTGLERAYSVLLDSASQ